MYQPGLRVMADTGVGVAEWLRHLGRPNPLPNIQPAVAPGNSGDGGCGWNEKVERRRKKEKKKIQKKKKYEKKKKKRKKKYEKKKLNNN